MKIENTHVFNTYPAVQAIRYSWSSEHESDSSWSKYWINTDPNNPWWCVSYYHAILGQKDRELVKKLIRAGTSHRKFLRQIFVSADLTFPIFLWKEMDTFKVGTVRNSESTMHTLTGTQLTNDHFEYPISSAILNELQELIDAHGQAGDNLEAKSIFLKLVNLLPSGFLQKSLWTANYEVLLNIYEQRKGHKLPQWETFRKWVKSLPIFDMILED